MHSTKISISLSAIALAAAPAAAQVTATTLVVEGGPVPGAPGLAVASVGNVATNGIGGFAVGLSDDMGVSRIYGQNPGDGSLMLLRAEGDVLADGTVTGVESFFGVSDSLTELSGTDVDGNQGIYFGDTKVLLEPEATPIPGTFWTFASAPDVTAIGIGHFVGGFSDTMGGGTTGRGLFSVDTTGDVKPLIVTGDVVGNTGGLTVQNENPGFGGGLSRDGTFYAYEVRVGSGVSADGVVVVNDDAVVAGSGILREGSAIDAAVGGLPGEAWDNFDAVKINEAGTLLVTGDTAGPTATDEFLFLDGSIVLREGDSVNGGTLTGASEWADLNESGDYGVVWGIDDGSDDLEALIVNGEVVLLEGDAIDFNGDGMIDGTDGVLQNFTGLRNVAIGERVDGFVDVYFTADFDFNGTLTTSDDLEAAVMVSVAIPEPTGLAAMSLAGVGFLARRRR